MGYDSSNENIPEPVRPPDVSSRPSIGSCFEHVPAADAEKIHKTVVIAPIRFRQAVNEDGSFSTLISYSCNFGLQCYSSGCVYAKGGRPRQ